MIGNLLYATVNVVFQLYWWAIFIRVILSWLPMAGVHINPFNPILRILYQITDPILEPLRRFTTFGMIDFSPIVALILLEVVRNILLRLVASSF